MTPLELPPLPAGTWLAVYLDRHEIVGRLMWAVTIRSRGGSTPVREWCAEEDAALAFALSQSDSRHLPMIDRRDGGSE